ncbi:MAG: hypothetical protein QY310_11565 [Candidatus Jettenia sp. CY-1]|uniref:Uncharacterized protein n=1 Tax=Candidatus Jettenia ecosi TaxID=2494326 RepID=A0A533QFU1_9BACT|nr:hypothetical protein [Candidatus Jettenia sp.]TLD43668.1 MAG: hypothetical protein JETT_0099 [Candidatus Jettenia ecosi]WKZ18067.1 MAG: hypothetical protein QY310_11565 [Candidatus Jettenia sp. CY-1]
MEVKDMCYECGCGNENSVMSPDSITGKTFEQAAKGSGITKRQAMENTFTLLKKVLGKSETLDKGR